MKYFDYAASTPPSKETLEIYVDVSTHIYGNPGSVPEAYILEQKCHQDILEALSLEQTCDLIFTSGGTEANNLAIMGTIKHKIPKNSHFITSNFEHASVYDVFEHCAIGNKISHAPINENGYVKIEEFKRLLQPNTKFISIMHVNNELGTEQPIKELYNIAKAYNPNIIFMVDMIQGLGKVKALTFVPDIVTISSHKIYGPKAVGAVILKKDLALTKIIYGGNKENGQRGGTQSLPAQAGFARSVQTICKNLDVYLAQVKLVKDYFEKEVIKLPKISLNATSDANVVSIFIDIDKLAIQGVKDLMDLGVVISTKSADSNLTKYSRSLKAINLSDYRCERTYRISFSHHVTINDIDILLSSLEKFLENEK